MVSIGDRLKNLRESKGLTQKELANIFGKTQRAISNYEAQDRELDYEMLEKYSKYFNVTVDYILGFNPETDKKITVPGMSETVTAVVEKDFKGFTKDQLELIQKMIDDAKKQK